MHPFVQKELNKETIKEIEKGTKIEIYYRDSTIKNSTVSYISEICEMKNDSDIFLALEDYKSAKQNKEISVLIGMPLVFLLCIVMALILIKYRGLPPMKKGSR